MGGVGWELCRWFRQGEGEAGWGEAGWGGMFGILLCIATLWRWGGEGGKRRAHPMCMLYDDPFPFADIQFYVLLHFPYGILSDVNGELENMSSAAR